MPLTAHHQCEVSTTPLSKLKVVTFIDHCFNESMSTIISTPLLKIKTDNDGWRMVKSETRRDGEILV